LLASSLYLFEYTNCSLLLMWFLATFFSSFLFVSHSHLSIPKCRFACSWTPRQLCGRHICLFTHYFCLHFSHVLPFHLFSSLGHNHSHVCSV
jgi:hypothetical protein